ncbi:MAG: hypothetical protein M3457_12750 [Chloroflexota bacterium]|nr:hypothetical protein [Chloroflexota bacterium]
MFNQPSLRTILLVDGIVSGAMGLMLLAGAGILDSAFDLPTAFLRGVGVVLLPWFALLAVVATRRVINRPAVKFVIAVNLAWVAASILLPFTGWIGPNALGIGFIIVQAMAVAVFALVQVANQAETAPAAPAQRNRSFQV